VQVAAPPGCEETARAFYGGLLGLAEAHPGPSVSDGELDALAARLAGAGAPVIWDGRLPGARRFYTADPFGNRIELLAG
jgi:hypothetical protein